MAGERSGMRNRTLEVTGEGKSVEVFWYAGMETGDAWVGGLACAETLIWLGRRDRSGLPPPNGNWIAGREGGAG